MELEELQDLWHSQDKSESISINMKAMTDLIQRKKESTGHLMNFSELLLIIINLAAGLFILVVNKNQPPSEVILYVLGAWMLGSSLYALIFRIRRTMATKTFDRSVRGDLDYALAIATYQVRLSQVMRWNVLPIGALTAMAVFESGKPIGYAIGILIGSLFGFYLSSFEHRHYVRRKAGIEQLKEQLSN